MSLSKAKLGDVAEVLTYPICEEIPLGEIFMCKVGHDICQDCFGKLHRKLCPSCRGHYENPAGRNFKVEKVIARIPLPCPYNCQVAVLRSEFAKHKNVCTERGKYADLCKLLKLDSNPDLACKLEVNMTNVSSALKHFQEVHGADYFTNNSSSKLFLEEDFQLSRKFLMIFKLSFEQRRQAEENYFMVRIGFPDKDSISWTCLYLGNSTSAVSHKFVLKLTFTAAKNSQPISWEIAIGDARGLESFPPVTVFTKEWLIEQKCMENNAMRCKVEIVKA